MENSPSPDQKKGLGVFAWIGIGCGNLVALVVVAFIAVTVIFGGKVKDFFEEAEKNPTRATVRVAMKVRGGQLELVAEDDVQKRYTLKDKKSGTLTTFYWDEKTSSPETVKGDFSAIPAEVRKFLGAKHTITMTPVSGPIIRKTYTLKEKKSGERPSFYWEEENASLDSVEGDSSAIPAEKKGAAPGEHTVTFTMKPSSGHNELVAERYTVRDKDSGELTTFYQDEKGSSVKKVKGDFSKIPTQKNEFAPIGAVAPGLTEPVFTSKFPHGITNSTQLEGFVVAQRTVSHTWKLGGAQMEVVAERYTWRDNDSGELTTFYRDGKESPLKQVKGDFSAIPAEKKESAPAEPSSTPAPAAGAAPNQN
jgi:hypothetical protein